MNRILNRIANVAAVADVAGLAGKARLYFGSMPIWFYQVGAKVPRWRPAPGHFVALAAHTIDMETASAMEPSFEPRSLGTSSSRASLSTHDTASTGLSVAAADAVKVFVVWRADDSSERSSVRESASRCQQEDGNELVNIAALATIFAPRFVITMSAGPVSTFGGRRFLNRGRRAIAARAGAAGAAAC